MSGDFLEDFYDGDYNEDDYTRKRPAPIRSGGPPK